ncbi:MAG: hypothetical protein COV70_03190 [Parcubacteria group bacterium CG11_big_fil_rev_8_21_14_0_20_39_22]|nr:MAG: hypothetical protein COV70_03190 [Parcubacteria group bacterium CG11_big_fil_rev_8_21_14_0_20_39_22]
MTKTILNIKIDTKKKKEAQRIAKKLGVPLSVVVNRKIDEFIQDEALHFLPVYKMSKKLERRLAKIEDDIKHGRNMSPKFSSMEEMMEHLKS